MKSTLLDLSKQMTKSLTDFYDLVSQIAISENFPFFIVGATARDMILVNGYGFECKRGTADIDIGIRVSSWDEYELLRKRLLDSGLFKQEKAPHKLNYNGMYPVDIVPFGPIGDENGNFTWPPKHDSKMSILGFQEAYENSQPVLIRQDPQLIVNFATPVGLTIMKLFSWSDGLQTRKKKDAYDLAYILRIYGDIVDQNLFSEEHSDLIEGDFNLMYAGARILGRDCSKILRPETKSKLLEILDKETGDQQRYPLVEDMMKDGFPFQNPFEEYLKLLSELKLGIFELSTDT